MEYLPGGDLYSLLRELGSLDEKSAKIYTYQIVQALGYLHSNGIIHRDLKPDNILISAEGFLKLTDFGLSYIGIVDRQMGEIVPSDPNLVKSSSFVGTPDYIAPEIILNQEHSFPVDWWSLGIILYEFIMGVPPFHANTEAETHERILKGAYMLPTEEDDDVSPECIDFIKQLLQLNPEKRLGTKGVEEILNHPWFKGIDSDHIEPVFKPELKSKEDTGYFQERYEFKGDSDSDIIDDINRSLKALNNPVPNQTNANTTDIINNPERIGSLNQPKFVFPQAAFGVASDISDESIQEVSEGEGNEIAQFPSVAISQLLQANLNEFKRKRTRSLFEEENVTTNQTFSKSFMNLAAVKRRLSRPGFVPETDPTKKRSFMKLSKKPVFGIPTSQSQDK